jgi:hypothetical protein
MRWVPFAVLVLLFTQPGKSFAGPPEKIHGKLVFDEVEDGLRKYRKATEEAKRIRWLEKLALANDPRVTVMLGETFEDDPNFGVRLKAESLLMRYYVVKWTEPSQFESVERWWLKNENDLRRRVKQLPR